MEFVDPSIGGTIGEILNPSSANDAFHKARPDEEEDKMTYQFNSQLFVENGPAVQAAAARARRAAADAFYLTEAARLEAARKVIGSEIKLAA